MQLQYYYLLTCGKTNVISSISYYHLQYFLFYKPQWKDQDRESRAIIFTIIKTVTMFILEFGEIIHNLLILDKKQTKFRPVILLVCAKRDNMI